RFNAMVIILVVFFFSSRRRHTRFSRDWSSDVCSSDLINADGRKIFWPPRVESRVVPADVTIGELSSPLITMLTSPELTSLDWARSEERRVGKECRCGGVRENPMRTESNKRANRALSVL